jgi:glucosamine-6-phosphate deaminase
MIDGRPIFPIATRVARTAAEAGRWAAECGLEVLRSALIERGSARIIVATGASQFDLLAALTTAPGVDWSRVTAFHLDEYIGLPADHPAAFLRYLRERFFGRLQLAAFHEIHGDASDPAAECARLEALLRAAPIDLCFLGIGENGHLAFNDPPADFSTDRAFIEAPLDEACRRQQLGEGWFPSLEAVPTRAITMTVPEILRAGTLICTVPDLRKAVAVRDALEGPLTPAVPASALWWHPRVHLFLDDASASMLSRRPPS